ncbi:hypothetical protein AVEN_205363-1, partial [Araneus ventricosus]
KGNVSSCYIQAPFCRNTRAILGINMVVLSHGQKKNDTQASTYSQIFRALPAERHLAPTNLARSKPAYTMFLRSDAI